MKFFLLSDDPDICYGMRLIGIEGEIVDTAEGLINALERHAADEEIGVILVSEGLAGLASQFVATWRLKRNKPLLVEIPNRIGADAVSENIAQYIFQAIGVRV